MARRICKAVASLLIASFCVLLVGCEKDVRAQYCELGIILPDDFSVYDSDDFYDLAYSDGNIIVGFTRISFVAAMADGIPATLNAKGFAEVYRERTENEECEIYEVGDIVYFEYSVDFEDSGTYHYMPTFYATPYAYFVIVFVKSEWNNVWDEDSILDLCRSVYIDSSAL